MFLTNDHKERYSELLQRDNTHSSDIERHSMFFVFSGYEGLYNKVNALYDFEDHSILPEVFENGEVDLTGSEKGLVELAFNLYNNYPMARTVLDVFAPLDQDNKLLALRAIQIRSRIE